MSQKNAGIETPLRALYPGSFDPPTQGHMDLIERAAGMFDEVIVAIAVNSLKQPLFSTEERLSMLRECCKKQRNVRIEAFEGKLLVAFAVEIGARVIVRGLRAVSDFEYEFQMAGMNHRLNPNIETCFLMTHGDYAFLSSSIVKEVAQLGGDVSRLVPPNVLRELKKKFGF